MKEYIQSTYFFDYENPLIRDFVAQKTNKKASPKEKVIQLYYAIRDAWRYNPYNISFQKEDYRASIIFQKKEAHCIDKSILMLSACRSLGVPARLCLAKVKNHIAVENLVEKFGTNELVPHGYVEVFLDEKWIKTTPVFNQELCAVLNVQALDFDGETDAIFQEFDKKGSVFMEYLEDYGSFADMPMQLLIDLMRTHYPLFSKKILEKGKLEERDFK